MKGRTKKYNAFQRFYRAFKLNFNKLFRSPGGAKKVSLGFAIGFGLEMIVISTAGLIYLLLYPIVRLSGTSLPAAIIGNVIGKLSFLPVLLLPFARKLGKLIYPGKIGAAHLKRHSFREIFSGNFQVFQDILHGGVHILIGMSIFGVLFGTISYFVVHYLYEKEKQRRIKKRNQIKKSRNFVLSEKRVTS